MIETTTTLNRIGAELGKDKDVHAVTDVTGFGVLGHTLELARGVQAGPSCCRPTRCRCCRGEAAMLSEKGLRDRRARIATGRATAMTWSCRRICRNGSATFCPTRRPRAACCVSCAADRAASIPQTVKAAGFPAARIIGKTESGKPSIKVVSSGSHPARPCLWDRLRKDADGGASLRAEPGVPHKRHRPPTSGGQIRPPPRSCIIGFGPLAFPMRAAQTPGIWREISRFPGE